MRDWKFWDWVAYSTMLVAAVILAAKEGSAVPGLQWLDSKFFAIAPLAFITLATVTLVAQSFGLVGSGRMARHALLRLESYPQGIPNRLEQNNIWRWYYLETQKMIIDTTTGATRNEPSLTMLFVSFDKPVLVGTLRVEANVPLPHNETKEFNSRFAIIVFHGRPPACLLTIRVFP